MMVDEVEPDVLDLGDAVDSSGAADIPADGFAEVGAVLWKIRVRLYRDGTLRSTKWISARPYRAAQERMCSDAYFFWTNWGWSLIDLGSQKLTIDKRTANKRRDYQLVKV